MTTERLVARRVFILFNPRAGSRSGRLQVDRLASLLVREGVSAEILTDIDRLAQTAADCQSSGCLRAVVAAGGDGTVALVANRTVPGTPIGILPLGTENLLAKHVGISPDPQELCRAILAGTMRQFDAGRAGNRLFLLMVGCGFDAEVVRRVHGSRRGHIRHLSYVKPILDSIRSYRYPELRVSCDSPDAPAVAEQGVPSESEWVARWVFIANLPCYAMGLPIVPEAVGDDGWLDVCAFKQGSLRHGMRYLANLVLRRHRSLPDRVTRRTRRLRVASEEQVPYQLDGDPGGYLPVEIEVLPGRLTLLVQERPLSEVS